MVKCGNRLCKFHNGNDIYVKCDQSPFDKRGKKIFVNMCPNEILRKGENNANSNKRDEI